MIADHLFLEHVELADWSSNGRWDRRVLATSAFEMIYDLILIIRDAGQLVLRNPIQSRVN